MSLRLLFAILVCVAACASPQRDKGGLVPRPDVSAEQLRASSGRRLALIVGVNQPRDESWPELLHAQHDAEALASALSSQAGRFEVELLVTPEQTRLSEILKALDRLAAKNRSSDDIVVVYFSGHGSLSRERGGELQRYLVTSDTTRRDLPGTGFGVDLLRSRFEALTSNKRALLLASCHSGTGKSLLPDDVAAELRGLKGVVPRPLAQVSSGVTVLSASAFGQPAREDDGLGHDIYTYFLLEALRQRVDRNGDGAVSVEEAHDYARERTYYFTGGKQTPTAESAVVGIDPIILSGEVTSRGAPEIGSYDEGLEGAEVKVDGVRAGTLPGAVTVPVGRHRISLIKGDVALAEATVELRDGERLDAVSLVRRPSLASVDLHLGYLALLSGSSARQVGSPVPFVGVGVRLEELLPGRLDAAAELGGTRYGAFIAPDGLRVPVSLSVISAGASAQWPFTLRRLRVGVGPHLSLAWVSRRFSDSRQDSALLLTPGLSVDGRVRLWSGLEWAVGARASYALASVDGATTHLGAVSLWSGLAWRLP